MELHTIQATLAILLLGGTLGFMGGLFGIGGGIIAIPMLVYGFGMDQAHAQGTALVMMAPNLLLGWYRYTQHHSIPTRTASMVAAAGCLSTWLFAHIAISLDQALMRSLFSLFLLGVSVHSLWRQAGNDALPDLAPRGTTWLPLVGLLGGASMGLLGVGGGLVASPFLTGWFRLRQTVAQSYSLVLVAPSSVVALVTYSSEKHVNWSIGLPLALGGLSSVSAGVTWAHKLPEKRIRTAFAWMLLLTAVWLLLKPLLHSATAPT